MCRSLYNKLCASTWIISKNFEGYLQIVRYNVRKKSAALNYSLFDAKGWIHLHYTPLSAKEKNQTDKQITAAVKIPKLMGVINCLYHVPQLHIRRSLEWDQTTSRNSWQPMRMLKIVSQPLHFNLVIFGKLSFDTLVYHHLLPMNLSFFVCPFHSRHFTT